jgi:hypothetical protein
MADDILSDDEAMAALRGSASKPLPTVDTLAPVGRDVNAQPIGSPHRNQSQQDPVIVGVTQGSQGGIVDQLTGTGQNGQNGGGALGPNWFNCAANGLPAVVLVNADVPVYVLPDGASVVGG